MLCFSGGDFFGVPVSFVFTRVLGPFVGSSQTWWSSHGGARSGCGEGRVAPCRNCEWKLRSGSVKRRKHSQFRFVGSKGGTRAGAEDGTLPFASERPERAQRGSCPSRQAGCPEPPSWVDGLCGKGDESDGTREAQKFERSRNLQGRAPRVLKISEDFCGLAYITGVTEGAVAGGRPPVSRGGGVEPVRDPDAVLNGGSGRREGRARRPCVP